MSTLTQAQIGAINTILNSTDSYVTKLANLKALALQYSAAAPSTVNGAVLYSGTIGTSAGSAGYGAIAPDLARTSGLAVLDDTARGEFLGSPEFNGAVNSILAEQFGEGTEFYDARTKYLYEADGNSLWSISSVEYVNTLKGNILALASNASFEKILGSNELDAALNNSGITGINGISRAELVALRDSEGIEAVFNRVKSASQSIIDAGGLAVVKVTVDGVPKVETVITAEGAAAANLSGTYYTQAELAYGVDVSIPRSDGTVTRIIKPSGIDIVGTTPEGFSLKGLAGDAAHGLGLAMIAFDVVDTMQRANANLSAGQKAAAGREYARLVGRQLGGYLGGGLGGLLGIETGPGAIATAIGGSALGSYGGDKLAGYIYDRVIEGNQQNYIHVGSADYFDSLIGLSSNSDELQSSVESAIAGGTWYPGSDGLADIGSNFLLTAGASTSGHLPGWTSVVGELSSFNVRQDIYSGNIVLKIYDDGSVYTGIDSEYVGQVVLPDPENHSYKINVLIDNQIFYQSLSDPSNFYIISPEYDGSIKIQSGSKTVTISPSGKTSSNAISVKIGDDGDLTVYSLNNDGRTVATDMVLDYIGNGQDTITLPAVSNVTSTVKNTLMARLVGRESYGGIGSAIGSALGSFLANGNQVEGVIYGSVLGIIGKDLASQLAGGIFASSIENELPTVSVNAFNEFAAQAGTQMASAGAGIISSTLAFQLAEDLGIHGFGAELLSTVASSTGSAVVNQVISNLANKLDPFAHFDTSDVSGTTNLAHVTEGAIGSFLGAKLGALLVQPKTQAAAVLSSLGSTIGSIVAVGSGTIGVATTALAQSLSLGVKWIANIVAPGIGAFIGFVLGALIGNLFGAKKPKIPTAGAETVLQLPYAQYKIGVVTSTNGGATDLVTRMAQAAAETLNGLIEQVVGGGAVSFVSNSTSPTVTYGYTGSQLYYKKAGGAAINVASADQAVDAGVLYALPLTQIIGGDIFTKRALKNSIAADIASLLGDVQTSKDYGYYVTHRDIVDGDIHAAYGTLTSAEENFYAANKALVDQIDMGGLASLNEVQKANFDANKAVIDDIVASLIKQADANPWIITLDRVTELGLNNWNSSDFNGGVAGFLQSFGFSSTGSFSHYEDVKLAWGSGSLTISDNALNGSGIFSVLNQATADGRSVTVSNFTSAMGYATAAMGTLTSGNTIESAAGVTSNVTFNNAGHGGYNIFIGGDGGNAITAGTNDTWIQGGAGTDVLHGGAGHDVIIAGSGNATIYGGTADSYLAAGSGTDLITGGGGNDTIVLGSGHDTVVGGAGNDLIILSALASGSLNGSVDGGTGSNTLSYERYDAGVRVSLGAWSSPSGTAYTINNIQNLTGAAGGGNHLTTGGTGGILEGGAGNDTFVGVTGGRTTVTFANSNAGVFIDLAQGISFGGSAVGDTFQNIQNLTGSAFDDELRGLAGGVLNGGAGGDDWFDYSGGGNTYTGAQNGSGSIDYSLASGILTANFTTGTAQVTGKAADTFSNITRIVGSTYGSNITGFGIHSITHNSGVVTTTASDTGVYFIPTGGNNTFVGAGYDTIELNRGAGTTAVTMMQYYYGDMLSGLDYSLVFGSSITYDDIWVSGVTHEETQQNGDGENMGSLYTLKISLGLRDDSASVSFDTGDTQNWAYRPAAASLETMSMNGASTLDLSGLRTIVGRETYTVIQYAGGWTPGIYETETEAKVPLGSVVDGVTTGASLIVAGGGATVINVDGGASTSNGSVIVAGKAATGGLVINSSAGDDQITFERGDGRYTINGTGGQKTIDFGPSVAASDVIYRVIGIDLYIGVQDLSNSALTADQVADNIKIVGGAIHTTNANGTLSFTHPFFIQVGGTSIDLSKLTTVDWTGGDASSIAEISTQNGSVSVSNMTVNVTSGLTGTVTGSGDTINAGTGSHITIAGTANVINTTSGGVTLSGINSALGVNGNSNTITMSGNGDVLTVNGSGNVVTGTSDTVIANTAGATLTVNGSGNTVYVRANNVALTTGASTVVFDTDNDGGTVAGTGSTIVTSGDALSLMVSGSSNTVYMRGIGDTLTASSTSVVFDNSGVTETVNGDSNALNITGYSDVINVNGTNDTVTGHWATINLTKTGTANTVSGIGLTVNAVNGDTVTMACNPTSGDQVSTLHMSSGMVHIQANSHIDLFGAGNTITAAGGDTFGVWGDNNSVVGTGANSISSNGNNLTLTMSNSSFTDSGSNVSAALNGDSNTIHANAAGEHFTINGANNLVEGDNATVTLSGTGRGLSVHGLNNTVVAGNLSSLDIDGTATVTASGSTISTAGWNGGTGNIAITGNNDVITLDGFGDTVTVNGTNETISGHWTTVNLTQANAAIAISGIGLMVNAAAGDAITISSVITSGDQTDTVNLSNGTVNVLSGSTVRVTGNNDTVTVQSGAYAQITSTNTGTTVTSNGGGVEIEGTVTVNASNTKVDSWNSNLTFSVTGAGNTINLYGSGDVVTVHGDNNTINNGHILNLTGTGNIVNGGSGTFNLTQSNATLTVNGSNDTINLTGSGDTLTLTGDGDTVNAGSGATIHGATLTGPQGGQITVTATNSTLTMANNGRLSIYGDGNTATLGTNTNLYLHGNSETVTQASGTATLWGANETVTIGSGATLWVYGDEAQVNTSGSTLSSSINSATTGLTGDNNTFTVQSAGNTVNLAGGGNTVNMSWGTLNISSANKALTVNGIGMSVNAANGDVVTMSGTVTSGDQISWLNMSGGTAIIQAGANVRVNGNNNAVTVASGGYAHITSTSTGVSVTSNGGYVEIEGTVTANVSNGVIESWNNDLTYSQNGSGTTINLYGHGDVLTLHGGSNTVNAGQATMNLTSSGTLSITGDDNTINATANSVVTVTTLSGPRDHSDYVNISSGTVNSQANTSFWVIGDSNIVNIGAGSCLALRGNLNTLTSTTAVIAYINGSNNLTTANVIDSSIYLDEGAETVTVTGAGNTITAYSYGDVINASGVGGTVNATWNTINLTSNSSYTVIGDDNTVNAAANSVVTVATLSGPRDQSDYVNISSGTVNSQANTSFWVIGDSNIVNIGAGSCLALRGNLNTLTSTAAVIAYINGNNNSTTVNVSNSSIYLDESSETITVTGTGNTITTYSDDDVINISGDSGANNLIEADDATVTLSGTGQSLSVHGLNNVVTADNLSNLDIDGTATVTTSGSTISTAGWGNSSGNIAITGDNDVVTLDGFGDIVTVNGTNETISGHWTTLNLTQTDATVGIEGIGLTVNAADGDAVTINCTLTSWDQVDTLNLSNGTATTLGEILINGNNNTISVQVGAAITGDNNIISFASDAWLNVDGSGNTITGNGATINLNSSGTLTVTGDNDTINAADGSTITVATLTGPEGDADAVNMNSGTVHYAANSSADLVGSGNTVTIADHASTWIGGDNNTVTITGASTLWTDGVNNTVTANNSQIHLDGSGQSLTLSGNGNTITAADGDTITVHGTGDVINASNSTIYKGNTSTVTINGTGNTVVTLGVAPIILDLGNDGLELTPVGSSDVVTTASNGALTRLGWVGPTNGILVTDRNGDGQYGDVQDISFTQDRIGAQTDLEGLAGWDSNGDGVISATDTGWSKLRVWIDANGDGVSESGEVRSLDQLGVSSISLKRDLTGNDGTLTTDSYASATSSFTRTDGTTGTSYDVTLGQQVLAASGWQDSLGTTWTQLTNYGQIGNLSHAATAQLGTSDASDINYSGLVGLDPVAEAIWGDFLDPVKNAARKAAIASGQVGDTSWMQQNGVTVTDPNRGAHVTTQRLQVLDLDMSGWGPSVTELGDSAVKVDVNLTGNPYSVAWVGASDGLLVIDAVDDGDIDVATEATFQSWVPYARTSLQGLTAFDTSGDGAIDADDKVFSALRIWSDRNGDGVSQAGEMTTLSDLGVKSISLTANDQNADTKTLSESQILASATVTMTDGSTHQLYDVALGVGDPNAKPDAPTTTTAAASAPTLQGLTPAIDVTVTPVTATSLDQSLTSPLDATTDQVSAARSSQGPAGEVMTADGNTGSTAGGWWQSDGYSLSDSINQFNAVGPDSEGQGATPVATANDAAMIQRHLLLRQAIAGFTVQGAAPAVFARQGGLDTLNTLAAATQSTTTPTSGMASKAA